MFKLFITLPILFLSIYAHADSFSITPSTLDIRSSCSTTGPSLRNITDDPETQNGPGDICEGQADLRLPAGTIINGVFVFFEKGSDSDCSVYVELNENTLGDLNHRTLASGRKPASKGQLNLTNLAVEVESDKSYYVYLKIRNSHNLQDYGGYASCYISGIKVNFTPH